MKKKIISIILIGMVSLSLIGCGEDQNTRQVTGDIINVESTAIVSKDITIKTEKGNEIVIHDNYGKCKQTKYMTKIEVTIDDSNKLEYVEYIYDKE